LVAVASFIYTFTTLLSAALDVPAIAASYRYSTVSFVFPEGTLVCKKDKYLDKHSDDIPIPNLEVMALLKSFKSKGYCRETFNWQYYYYYLTNEGIEYLRQYLALPEEIVPATLKKAATPAGRPSGRPEGEGGFKGKGGPGGDFNPDFARGDRGASREGGYRRERN
jgi:small subunit ribosomal protein S10e